MGAYPSQHRSPTPVVRRVAERLAGYAREPERTTLPSRAALAKALGVSTQTVAQGARLLREEGVLVFGKGQRMRIAGRGEGAAGGLSSADRLFGDVKEGILQGVYRAGDSLPKIEYFVIERSISNHTVLGVYRRLIKAGLIHKKGKGWYVGRGTDSFARAWVADPPVVLLVMDRESRWAGMHDSRTGAFPRRFAEEAEQAGIRIIPFVVGKPGPEAATVESAISAVRRHGTRYLGTLVSAGTREIHGLDRWFRLLARLDRPVVWFDRYDEGFPAGARNRLLTRCHFSERRAVEVCLQFLAHSGHRHIAYGGPWVSEWILARYRIVRDTAAMLSPPLVVTPVGCVDIGTQANPQTNGLLEAVERFRPCDVPPPIRRALGRTAHLPALLADFVQEHRSRGDATLSRSALADVLVEKGGLSVALADKTAFLVTVSGALARSMRSPPFSTLIAPNDKNGLDIRRWMDAAGIGVPSRMSLISFDNDPGVFPLPITTVDFGFSYLGFAAFHSIAGDVPLKRGADGSIAAEPRIVRRGSVAPVAPPTSGGRGDRGLS